MKRLHFDYEMKLEFDAPIWDHRFSVRCMPQTTEHQLVEELQITVSPEESLGESQDSFGNRCIYGYTVRKHQLFSISSSGTVLTGLTLPKKAEDLHRLGMYRYQSHYTKPGPCILSYASQFSFSEGLSNREKAVIMMQRLFRDFSYVQGVTAYDTPAETAMELGRGVCQDYSHILISLCRLKGILARYVVGMLMGEGLSHAWVEIYDSGYWYGLDPTNNLLVEDQHIKISHGRDYKDCPINQGVFSGNAGQRQSIRVRVAELSGDSFDRIPEHSFDNLGEVL